MKKLFLIILSFVLFSSCSPERECEIWSVPFPPALTFQITYGDGLYYSDSILKLVWVQYELDGIMKVDSFNTKFIDEFDTIGLVSEYYNRLKEASAHNGVRDFYLHFPDGSMDTMYLEVEYVDDVCQAKLEDCYCNYPVRKLIYNGKEAEKHELADMPGVRQAHKVVR